MSNFKCIRCNLILSSNKFKIKKDNTYTKMCIECLNKNKINIEKNKCEHGKRKYRCKDCGGNGICEHNRDKYSCIECGGTSICEHSQIKSKCIQCGGNQICEHLKIKSRCIECKGSGICEHNKRIYTCIECKGSGICEHNKRKSRCIECFGNEICDHFKIKSECIKCGGSVFCEHNKKKYRCVECEGSGICEHKKRRSICKECDISGYLSHITRFHIYYALKSDKEFHSIEYLGCDIKTFKIHIENKFTEGMSWENHGEWHIDHIIPIKYKKDNIEPKLEEITERLHYKNTQPLWAKENMSKGNRYIG